MQTQLDRLQKQLLLGTEINAIIKQSTKLIEIVTANQEEVNRLKAQSDRLEKERKQENLATASEHMARNS